MVKGLPAFLACSFCPCGIRAVSYNAENIMRD